MFLLPSELGFLRFLKEAKVPLNEFSFPPEKVANVQSQVCPAKKISRNLSKVGCCVARETTPEELLPARVCTARLQVVSPSLRIVFSKENLRCQPT